MAKKRKSWKNLENDNESSIPEIGVSFNIEEDAAEIFANFIDQEQNFGAEKKKTESASTPSKPSSKAIAKSGLFPFEIDLHGKTDSEAKSFLDGHIQGLFEPLRRSGGSVKIRVITGKGIHSPTGRGLLIQSIYQHVLRKYQEQIEKIDAAPAETLISGVPVRGHFDVTFKIRKTGK